MEGGLFREELVVLGLAARDREQAIRETARLLYERGFVKDSFADAAVEREKVFATGLETKEGVNVAIPHTDVEHVIKPAVAVAVLKDPVLFEYMGEPGRKVAVKVVFLLAVRDPDAQLSLLQKLVDVFQAPGVLGQIAGAEEPARVIKILAGRFGG